MRKRESERVRERERARERDLTEMGGESRGISRCSSGSSSSRARHPPGRWVELDTCYLSTRCYIERGREKDREGLPERERERDLTLLTV